MTPSQATLGAVPVATIANESERVEAFGVDAVLGASFNHEEMAEGMLWVNLSRNGSQNQ